MSDPPSDHHAPKEAPEDEKAGAHGGLERVRVLLVEAQEVDRVAFQREVQRQKVPYDVQIATSAAAARGVLAREAFNVVLIDQALLGRTEFDLIDAVEETPVIVFVTRADDIDNAMRASPRGAVDYLLKDTKHEYLKLLPAAVTRALARQIMLREAQHVAELLQEAFDDAPIGKALVSADGRFLRLNRALGGIVGCASAELVATGLAGVAAADDLPSALAGLQRLVTGTESTARFEMRWRHRTGQLRWVQVDASRLRRDSAEDVVVVWQVQDVTERRQVGEALRESEARYRHLLENVTGYTYTATIEGGRPAATTHSPGSLNVTGYTAADHSAHPFLWFELVEPADRAAVEQHVAAALRGEIVKSIEHRIRHRNGGVRWVRNTLSPRLDVAGGRIACDGLIEDITGRKLAEEALVSAKSFLQQLVDTTPGMIFVLDREGRLRFANRFSAEYYGMTPESLLARTTTDVHRTPTEASAYVSDDLEVIRTGRKVEKDEPNTAPDGTEHWFHTVKVPLTRSDGTVDVLGIATDITARKQAEHALRLSEERYRTLTAAAFEGIGISENGVVVDANEQLLAMLGCAREEMVGRPVIEFIAPESRELVAGRLRTGDEQAYEHFLLRKDGTALVVESRARMINVGERHLRLTAVRDMTERKLAEQALRESEDRFRTIAEQASDGIFLADARGHFQDVNPAGCEMLRYSSEEIRGQSIADVVVPEEVSRIGPEVSRLRDDKAVQSEWHFRRKDGTTFVGEVNGRLLPDGRLLGVVRDITERKRAEERKLEFERRMLDAQRLEALGTLAGGVAHDFNNILAAIFGNVALARMEVPGNHPTHAALAEIAQLSERARDLVRQILTFSRPQSHQRAVVRLEPLVHEAARMLRAMIPATVQLEVEFAETAPAALADATQIHQVFVNLCTNAWQAIGTRPGRVSLRLVGVEVSPAEAAANPRLRPGTFAVLSVIDTGCGMDAETLKHVFDPFYTTKSPGHGTGLGLAVVHGIVNAHEGFVVVRSEPGQGSVFQVYLPAARELPLPPAMAAKVAGSEPGRRDDPGFDRVKTADATPAVRVLLVDDEAPVAKICARLLQRSGFVVQTFTAPDAALAAFQSAPAACDLVITDMSMPEMNGIDFTLAIHAVRPDIPVILTTGFTASLTEESAQSMGISALINKPVGPDELVATVRRVLAAHGKIG